MVEDAIKIEVQFLGDEDDDTYTAKVIGRDALTDSALIQLTQMPKHPLSRGQVRRLVADGRRRLGRRDRQSVRLRPHGHGRRGQRDRAAFQQQRPHQRDDPDRRRHQSRQLGRAAAQRPRRGDRHQHRDHQQRTGGNAGNIGIGFAVPINTVRELLPQLRTGKIVRGRIGVQVLAVPRDDFADYGLKSRMGALVAQVVPGGASAKAGIQPGDVIIEFNGRPVANRDELVKMVVATKPGMSVPVKLLREKQEKTVNVTVEELDLEAEQQQVRGGGRGGNNNASRARGAGRQRVRLDAAERDAADGAAAADAVGPVRRGDHRRRSLE